MKKTNLLGIELTDYSLKESMKNVEKFLHNGPLDTISYVSTRILIEAAENEEQKEWISSMDMTICGEADILRAANLASRNRIKEVENDEFLKEFVSKMARGGHTVFLIAESEAKLANLEAYLKDYHSELLVVGTYLLGEGTESEDAMVNEINDVAPDVIISRLSYPKQEKLIFDNKKRINGEIWLALLEQMDKPSHRSEKLHKVKVYLYKKVFRRRVNKYHKTKD
ncbi:MAG: hypothetical protein HGA25_01525 [Clostridiales bacterium]|nr:hypothetical protein [Clostridiales bacterium]